ncbi:hypothetical protein BASA81_002625 [Batrachochytrium salamandrivorans]|nr:hypothetical protein BASA81_007886 [Batrachochytrium salamandrivorans]KAH9259005.1 hypothetical protein BASA81_002625 [Batrachochytrium salamandrivorans]
MELEEFLLEEQRGRLASSRFLVLALPAKHVHDAHYEVFGDYRKFDAGLEAALFDGAMFIGRLRIHHV